MFPLTRVESILLAALVTIVVSCSSPQTEQTTTGPTAGSEPTETTVIESTTSQPSATSSDVEASPFNVLVFHKTAEFRHDSIDAGIQAVTEQGAAAGYDATVTDDASVFTADGLQDFDVIVFLNTTGDVLDEDQQRAMEDFIRAGKGFVGVHSAADTEYDWQWYGTLLGAYFDSHPDPQDATVDLVDPGSHPVVAGVPDRFERFDEWYNFRARPAPDVTILAAVDESSYEGGAMGDPHPIVWAHEFEGGRSVYVGFGHTPESFGEPLVRALLDNAVRWAAGQEE